ncbi:ribosome small subunit-dependent GTPase A [Spiribacter aquaticus]|uniref:Small ribosomal subunit biogenesis GTPase RsgA n=1 Tax=Spiribacter aquaticus TaxID=1935996 RepID=A0A557RFJ5_9GAMM|nr:MULTISPECIES: ribosome small subunit-dependent GTPase A [Spiribacter]KAF0280500.1 ribosome small subunit-dependent GTPase A [Spiribacter roseus]TVO63930.1 ribosome small subunit-dependent GTPase A [Spiribacter aquaticus]
MDETGSRVIVSSGNHCLVADSSGALHRCHPRSRRAPRPVCGDRVDWSADATAGWIDAIRPRTNLIERGDFRGRPRGLAANIDRIVVVIAPQPAPDALLIDRYIVLGEALRIPLLIWCHKQDLAPSTPTGAMHALRTRCERQGIVLMTGSLLSDDGLAHLRTATRHEALILVGQSGVGKSSITQALIPTASRRIGEISATSGQGRHTTSATTWFERPDGGAVVDSPGVRTLRLDHLSASDVDAAYPEIAAATRRCRFNDCRHGHEPACAIRQGLESGEIDAGQWQRWQRLREETGG